MNSTSAADRVSRIRIAARQAVSVMVEAGTEIRCVSGRIWLTQEGDARDHCIPAGVTFWTDRAGQAVMSSISGPSVAIVSEVRHARAA